MSSSNLNVKMLGINIDVQAAGVQYATTASNPSTCYFPIRPLHVSPDFLMEVDAPRELAQSAPGPEVLPPATEVEPTISPQFTQDTIDPAFRLPVVTSQSSAQQPQQASDQKLPAADENQSLKKAAKKGAQGPRLRKACDSCSRRKVKCDEAGPPCKACVSLDIPCTFSRPSRRRGPRNRHADAIKGQLANATAGEDGSRPSSPTYAAQTLASLAQQPVLSADSICPPALLDRFVDDYFKYIHPMIPVPHEPAFRAALTARADTNDMKFLALLASMVGCLVASIPRRPKQHILELRMERLIPNSTTLIDRCWRTAIEARGLYHLDRPQTIEDAEIAYLQGVIGAYQFEWDICRLYMGQCVTISRVIGLHRQDGPGSEAASNANRNEAVMVPGQGRDVVVQELSKRMFWVIFSTVSQFQQMGVSARELSIPPPSASEPYPDLPLEIDDAYITHHDAHPMPQGEISELVGFNANMRVYKAVTDVSAMDLAYGPNNLFDWDRQKLTLQNALDSLNGILGAVPSEFLFGRSSSPKAPAQNPQYPLPTQGYPEVGVQFPNQIDGPKERKQTQIEIQKANLYAAQIATRFYLIEKYSILSDSYHASHGLSDAVMENGPPGSSSLASSNKDASTTVDELKDDRDFMLKDLLRAFEHLDVTYLEPSGLGFTNKIRQVTTISMNMAPNRKSDFHRRVEPYLMELSDFLSTTQRSGPKGAAADGTNEDELRARQWAELLQFINSYI
ncbi:MAG: hypothetical protein Q9201_004834 [Fulgogasparrea decipioides]